MMTTTTGLRWTVRLATAMLLASCGGGRGLGKAPDATGTPMAGSTGASTGVAGADGSVIDAPVGGWGGGSAGGSSSAQAGTTGNGGDAQQGGTTAASAGGGSSFGGGTGGRASSSVNCCTALSCPWGYRIVAPVGLGVCPAGATCIDYIACGCNHVLCQLIPDAGPGDARGGDGGTGGSGGISGKGGTGGAGGITKTGGSSGSAGRALDLLFVIDNSPSMDPKQRALAAAFPMLMSALQSLPMGLPDLHIGVISSDMGAGTGEAGGNCSVILGNQGILWGNDPTADPFSDSNKYATVKNRGTSAGNAGCGMNSGARWIEDLQDGTGGGRSKNYVGNLQEVFTCLASAVGTSGCGYEHTLQSLRVALNPQQDVNQQNVGFLRPNAALAIVIISDEDDCSAAPNSDLNDGMFASRTLGDTASLRCAARGHVCNASPIPNYDPSLGYTGTAPFVANLADCEAKDDTDTRNLPLIRVRDIIESVKQVKPRPDQQILVSGIIGWPRNGDLTDVLYRIDKDPTSQPVEQSKLWDYMPLCTVPTLKSTDGNIYKAYAALRLKKFIDGFGAQGRTYSICDSDLSPAMLQIGESIGSSLLR